MAGRTTLNLIQGITDFSKRVHVKDLFEKFGELHACWLPPVGRRCGGEYGYVKFKREAAAEEAYNACKRGLVDLWGVKLAVDWRLTPTTDVQHDHDFDAKGSNLLSSRDLYRQELLAGRARGARAKKREKSSSSSSSGKRRKKDKRRGDRRRPAEVPTVRDIENRRSPQRKTFALEDNRKRNDARDYDQPKRGNNDGYDRSPVPRRRERDDYDRDGYDRGDDRGYDRDNRDDRGPDRGYDRDYDRRGDDRRGGAQLRSRSPAERGGGGRGRDEDYDDYDDRDRRRPERDDDPPSAYMMA